jgi:hypothetical protein
MANGPRLFPVLRAHFNVIPLSEWRRERERKAEMDDGAVRISLCVPPIEFVRGCGEIAEAPPEPPRKPRWGFFRWFRRPKY